MAENLTLARPYAEAAFELARARGNLEPWEQALARMAQVVSDPQMRQCIGNPKFSAEQLAQVFIDVSGKLADDAKNFVHILVENERLPVLPEILELFVRLKNAHEGVKQAQVTSAFPLDDAALKKLIAELEPRFKCKLEASVSVDPELIGGVRVAVGDEVIDASVRGKLATMTAAL
ncbi:MAG TPA: F0F1 ATP synthase subunit delta, partial [Burkholderiales bacterium]